MKRTTFGIIAIVIALGLIVSCASPLDQGIAVARFTAPDGTVVANPALAEAIGNMTGRTNSSGISIPSNAHSLNFQELTDVYFTWVGNGQDRNFFAYVLPEAWDVYCWVGVTTQQGPKGYQTHLLYPAAGNGFVFEKLHNNITQAWLEGGQVHDFCPKCDECVICGDCDCEDDEGHNPDCWGECCTIKIANDVSGNNPQGWPFEVKIFSTGDQASRKVVFNLRDGFFNEFESDVKIRVSGTYVRWNLIEQGTTVNVSANYVLLKYKVADADA